MKIQQSAEDYLESILVLGMSKPYVRSIDVANDLGFSKPSVSVAMKNMRDNGYISMSSEGHITLLEPGAMIAKNIYERHTTISGLLTAMGVPEKIAADDACRIEHVISPETFDALKEAYRRVKDRDLKID